MKAVYFLTALLCLWAIAGIGQADIYKWVDEQGTVTFQDTPPPEGVESAVIDPKPLAKIEYDPKITVIEEVQEALSKVGDKAADVYHEVKLAVAAGGEVKAKKELPRVDLYITSWCGYCSKAKAFLRSNNIPFNEYDIEEDPQAAKRHRELNPRGGVPVAVIGERVLRGFSPELYRQALAL